MSTSPKVWFTADTHFGVDSTNTLRRDMRPFKDPSEYMREQVAIWNNQVREGDIIYVIGDFCNFNHLERNWISGLSMSSLIHANIRLITGNSEDRVVESEFGGDYGKFVEFCMNHDYFNFESVARSAYITIDDQRFFLVHKPSEHDKTYPTLFGHIHRAGGLWRPYGLNVGVDLNHFRLYSSDDIKFLMGKKSKKWDDDPDLNCFKW